MTNSEKNRLKDKAFQVFGVFCTFIGLVILAVFLFDIAIEGFSRIDWDFLTSLPSRRASRAGILTAWAGTLWILVLTAIIAFPLGVGAGIYLEEYSRKNRWTNFLEINIANLAGVPSIIYGLLGLEVFVRQMRLGGSLLAGALTLSLLILPIIIVTTREAIKAVPRSVRDGSFALGASKWQTVWNQVLPASFGGILTGIILSLSRAVGEAAPLIVIGALAYVPFTPATPLDEFTVLPIQIFNWTSRPQEAFLTNAAGAIIVLLAITFLLNGIAVYLRNRQQKKIKW
ncbi:phosphate ABC transporter permease PtsA [Pontibacter diazotrophicus]|uniref:Phosphate transport system permease protein PstA n=1 Tax=Pontibacter diazotrophicus TaxID=1400979 RepID=A0A3D8LF90_9BACT|nr:phosphate ABC transporter permease PstA [Pontibacter diazotrophicus]RDV15592.1 phosphate ABC transporter permease PtsA [Pontibacter diazotrophicus]